MAVEGPWRPWRVITKQYSQQNDRQHLGVLKYSSYLQLRNKITTLVDELHLMIYYIMGIFINYLLIFIRLFHYFAILRLLFNNNKNDNYL